MYVCPVMGFNVSQIKCADCAAFSPHSGFVSQFGSSVFCTSKYGRTELRLKIKALYGADMADLLNIST